jgi:hypothetical protein
MVQRRCDGLRAANVRAIHSEQQLQKCETQLEADKRSVQLATPHCSKKESETVPS